MKIIRIRQCRKKIQLMADCYAYGIIVMIGTVGTEIVLILKKDRLFDLLLIIFKATV